MGRLTGFMKAHHPSIAGPWRILAYGGAGIILLGCSERKLETAKALEDNPPPPLTIRPGQSLWEQEQDLNNIPVILSKTLDADHRIRVLLQNQGATTLVYFSAGQNDIQACWTVMDRGVKKLKWDWCGTGKDSFEPPPGQTNEFVIPVSVSKPPASPAKESEFEIFGLFTEKSTDRSGLVPMITESEIAHLERKH